MSPIAFRANGRCGAIGAASRATGAAGSGAARPFELTGSVGRNGRNLRDDVIRVQDGLKQIGPPQGGQSPAFSVDGNCGNQTITAIQHFQLKHFGWGGADGLVEPKRQTHEKMNQILRSLMISQGTGAHQAGNNQAFSEAISMAQRWILKAQAYTTASLAYVNMPKATTALPGFTAGDKMRLLNFNFDLYDVKDKERRIRFVLKVLHRMQMVFQRPGGLWGTAAFEPDPTGTADNVIAYTWMGGFYRGGQSGQSNGHTMRIDTIYLTPLFGAFKNTESRARTIVHELAHFVGQPERIDDHAYEWDHARMGSLTPDQRLFNADTYAKFVANCASAYGDLA
jgi:hypothetical protein